MLKYSFFDKIKIWWGSLIVWKRVHAITYSLLFAYLLSMLAVGYGSYIFTERLNSTNNRVSITNHTASIAATTAKTLNRKTAVIYGNTLKNCKAIKAFAGKDAIAANELKNITDQLATEYIRLGFIKLAEITKEAGNARVKTVKSANALENISCKAFVLPGQ